MVAVDVQDSSGLDWRRTNLALWEEMAPLHPSTELYDIDGLVSGRDDVRPWEDEELGSVAGLDLLHLQCHIATGSLRAPGDFLSPIRCEHAC